MDKSRIMVAVSDNGGEIFAKLLLTDDQLRLLKWMQENECVSNYANFQTLDEITPVEI